MCKSKMNRTQFCIYLFIYLFTKVDILDKFRKYLCLIFLNDFRQQHQLLSTTLTIIGYIFFSSIFIPFIRNS